MTKENAHRLSAQATQRWIKAVGQESNAMSKLGPLALGGKEERKKEEEKKKKDVMKLGLDMGASASTKRRRARPDLFL
jgi:hypothetical protein